MKQRPANRIRTAICAIAVVAALLPAVPAVAQPVEPTLRSSTPFASTLAAGPARASVQTTEMAVPQGSRFSYTATVSSKTALEYLQVRMRLFMPGGRLVYQKTFVDTSKRPGPFKFVFERGIADIDLRPAAYPTEFSVRVVSGGKSSETTLKGFLLVYDPRARRRGVTLLARVSALPLTDPEGRFVIDPATTVRARDDLMRLTDYVLGDRSARLSVSVSPLMLEEWRQISAGYRYESPEGPVEVAATDETPRLYGSALSRLYDAVATGRLEMLSCGYSDPDLAELEGAGLSGDVAAQYAKGISAVFASISVTPSAGTAPARGHLSEKSAAALAREGIRYAFVDSRFADDSDPGVYESAERGLRLLVYDAAQGSSTATASTDAALAKLFGQYLENKAGPIPVAVEVGRQGFSANRVIALSRAIARQPWTNLQTASAVRRVGDKLPSLTLPAPRQTTPDEHWKSVADARRMATAVTAGLGSEDAESISAERDSLIAEASAWSGVGISYSERALSFASAAIRTAETVFARIRVTAQPVTLAGTRGKVPITITNSSEKIMRVTVLSTPSGTMRKGISPPMMLSLQHQENFIEVPVDLQGSLSGTLRVAVMAGDVQIAERTVQLSASVMDRLVVLGGIVLVLAALLAFIIVRVRKYDRSGNGASAAR